MVRAISLQGPQAVGKTTALEAAEQELISTNISYEIIRPIVEIRNERNLSIFEKVDFLENQRLFIEAELERYASLPDCLTVLDKAPRVIGMEWDSEALLSEELYRLRKCSVESILYLTARDDILLERKKADTTRARFSFKIEHFHAFRGWYSQTLNVRIFDVSDFSAENLKIVVLDWIQEHATNI